ncbi:MAG: hypothetical protein L0K27_08850 [Corynebacterium nuruki]|nr:hypothetical protein [Corynebacterium nuruki]
MTGPQHVVTLWFVTAAEPRKVLTAEPRADRGFARKFLSQLNPSWPLTHIGDFDMNRSAPPGPDEFYIGGFPGLSVVQTVIPELGALSQLPELTGVWHGLTTLIPAADLYATVHTPGDPDGLAGAAHWAGRRLKRSFCATRDTIIEDEGLPEPFEARFWEGTTDARGIQLSFLPSEFALAAVEYWLGVSLTEGSDLAVDVPVAAFAVDGRPAPRQVPTEDRTWFTAGAGSTTSPAAGDDDYDDYAADAGTPAPDTRTTPELLRGAAVSVGRGVRSGFRMLQDGAHAIGDEVRRRARNTGR